jgi:hypothetical protein
MAGKWHVSHCYERGHVSFVFARWGLRKGANAEQIGVDGVPARQDCDAVERVGEADKAELVSMVAFMSWGG